MRETRWWLWAIFAVAGCGCPDLNLSLCEGPVRDFDCRSAPCPEGLVCVEVSRDSFRCFVPGPDAAIADASGADASGADAAP